MTRRPARRPVAPDRKDAPGWQVCTNPVCAARWPTANPITGGMSCSYCGAATVFEAAKEEG